MVSVGVISEKGSRDINEDTIGYKSRGDEWCFVIADGLGGHGKGEVASGLAVRTALEMFEKRGFYDDYLPDVFKLCQNRLIQEQKNACETMDMKTTMVICCVNRDSIRWGHIGDSRLYLFEGGFRLVKRTLDHSVPQMLVYAKEIREKDIRFHPDRNRLMKALGAEWSRENEYELGESVGRKRKQALLLCTDGFWELIEEKAMLKALRKADSAQN